MIEPTAAPVEGVSIYLFVLGFALTCLALQLLVALCHSLAPWLRAPPTRGHIVFNTMTPTAPALEIVDHIAHARPYRL